ncbi:hypothetical protein D5P88_06135 [Salmonella enterica subsp. enterica]|nr:hypothetical protein [Salmonella enterica subsp. enterica]
MFAVFHKIKAEMRGKGLRYFSKEVEDLRKRKAGVIITGLIHDKESGNWRYCDPIKKLRPW